MRRVSPALLCCLHFLQACSGGPPRYSSDEDDANVYADVVNITREVLNVSGTQYLHPYLAVAQDEDGDLLVDLSTFEYEPSNTLDLLRQRDSTVVLCQVGAQGLCARDYLVVSQIARVSGRDAVVIVRSIRGPTIRALIVRLRYTQGTWNIAGAEMIT